MSFFSKNQKILKVGKSGKFVEETEYFQKKALSFQKASLPKWEVAKYAGDSRPFCSTAHGKNET